MLDLENITKLTLIVMLWVSLIMALFLKPAYAAPFEKFPDFESAKVTEDIEWAVRHARDPYLVLAHIRVEAGPWALGVSKMPRRFRSTATHTYVSSGTSDYGRHQINCKAWKAFQRWNPVPKETRIKRCSDLYRDETNRRIYYHLLDFWESHDCSKANRIQYGVPHWLGHYNTGFSGVRKRYLRKVGKYYRHYRQWRKYHQPPSKKVVVRLQYEPHTLNVLGSNPSTTTKSVAGL